MRSWQKKKQTLKQQNKTKQAAAEKEIFPAVARFAFMGIRKKQAETAFLIKNTEEKE